MTIREFIKALEKEDQDATVLVTRDMGDVHDLEMNDWTTNTMRPPSFGEMDGMIWGWQELDPGEISKVAKKCIII